MKFRISFFILKTKKRVLCMEKVTKLTKKNYLKQKNKILIGNILQANKHLDW